MGAGFSELDVVIATHRCMEAVLLLGKQVRGAQPPVALRTALMNTDSLKAYIRCTIVFALVSPT